MKNVMTICAILVGLIVTALHGQWEPDIRLTYNDSLSNTSGNNAWCVAASGSNVRVVWSDDRDGNEEIYTKYSTDFGSTWGLDTRLTNDTMRSENPSVAVSGSNVHVVWCDNRNDNPWERWEIWYKRSTDSGLTWGLDRRLSLDDTLLSEAPSATVSGNYIHVFWQNYHQQWEYAIDIHYRRSTDNGTTWDPRVFWEVTGSQVRPSAAVSGSNVHVAWCDDRDGNSEIYYMRSTNSGTTWDGQDRLTNDYLTSYPPSVAVSGSNVHVVWSDDRDMIDEIYYKFSQDSGTTWGLDTRLTNDPAYSMIPSVAVSGSNVHVVWCDDRDGNSEIYYKCSSDSGTTWGPDTRLTNDPSLSLYPSVAVSGSNVHVVWRDDRDGNSEIYYKRNPTGNIDVVESGSIAPVRAEPSLTVRPNPFIFSTTIPGWEHDWFVVYDAGGRIIGTYQGSLIGIDLAAGVYFIQPENRDVCPSRILKIR